MCTSHAQQDRCLQEALNLLYLPCAHDLYMWGRFDMHKQNAHVEFLDCSAQYFQVEKEVIMRKTVMNSRMLVRLTTLLTTAFTVLNRKKQRQDKGEYFHPDDSILWWAAINSFK